MGRGNPNWIRAAKERRALALRNEQSKPLSVAGLHARGAGRRSDCAHHHWYHSFAARRLMKPTRKTRDCVEGAAPFRQEPPSRSGAPELREVLRGDASAWRRFLAYYEPPLRALVHDAAEATELFSDADVDDVLGDFWLAVVSDRMRMLRAFKPERGADLLTWLALHVSHVAHERLQEKSDAPSFIPFDEKRHGAASVTATVDEAIRAAVRDAITRELRNPPSTSAIAVAPAVDSEYVSAARAAEIAGVRPATIREWVSRGRLPSHRAGRLVRIKIDDLHRFLAGGREQANVVDIEKRRRRALESFAVDARWCYTSCLTWL